MQNQDKTMFEVLKDKMVDGDEDVVKYYTIIDRMEELTDKEKEILLPLDKVNNMIENKAHTGNEKIDVGIKASAIINFTDRQREECFTITDMQEVLDKCLQYKYFDKFNTIAQLSKFKGWNLNISKY